MADFDINKNGDSFDSPHQDISYKWEDPRETVFEPIERSANTLYEDKVVLVEFVNDHVDEIVITNKYDADIALEFNKGLNLDTITIPLGKEHIITEDAPDFYSFKDALSNNLFKERQLARQIEKPKTIEEKLTEAKAMRESNTKERTPKETPDFER